ncbi:MAG: tetratricopeptide repeat protein [Acidobacteriota bacterium]
MLADSVTESILPSGTDRALEATSQLLAEGKWRKAEKACLQILEHGSVPGAACLLGQIYVASGQPNRGLEWFKKARIGDPENATTHFGCAGILQTNGDAAGAAAAWIAGIQVDPTYLPAHLGLSDTLLALGLFDAAMIAARQALLVDPNSADGQDRLGLAAELAGNRGEALTAFERSIALRPQSPGTLRKLAALQIAEGHEAKGRELIEQVIGLQPRNAGLRFEYALVLSQLGNRTLAVAQLREALRLQPRFPEALSNLGLLLRAELRFSEAESAYKKACTQNPAFAPAWNNLANLYVELVRLDDAERCYTKAIAIDPDYADAHTGRAMLRLLMGRLEEGWAEYEWRKRQAGYKNCAFVQPEWDGSNLEGRTILLHAEQGAGDTIQFIRYARLLKNQGAHVIVQCPASLKSLLSSLPEVDAVFSTTAVLPAFDLHAPLLTLPRLCGTDPNSIPNEIPYLQVAAGTPIPNDLLKTDKLRVGLVWAGNPNHHNDRNRSIPSASLDALLGIKGTRFFSLQVGGGTPPATWITSVIDLAPVLCTYEETAACLMHLDLLITVDTSVAHLAGGLGRPVWMALPACNDWRWLLDRSDSPWYPTMKIFRQRTPGDWSEVIRTLESECRVLVSEFLANTAIQE